MEREKDSHPAFGQIYIGRTTGTANFYGSELEQDHYITVEVNTSYIQRDLSRDWYQTDENVLRLRMSSGQFSELITSLNNGCGVPCTLEYVKGEKIPALPKQESRKELVHRKFKERMKEFGDRIRQQQEDAKLLVKKKTLTKDEMHKLQMHLDWLTGEVERNIPFFAECFQETMDEVVFEAKTEVENAIQHKINVLGLSELHKQQKLIDNQ